MKILGTDFSIKGQKGEDICFRLLDSIKERKWNVFLKLP